MNNNSSNTNPSNLEQPINRSETPQRTDLTNDEKKTLKKRAEEVEKLAKIQEANIAKLKEHVESQSWNFTNLSTPPKKKNNANNATTKEGAPVITVGEYVSVLSDWSRGSTRPAGTGWVKDVKNEDGQIFVTVEYDICKSLFKKIKLDDITITSQPIGRRRPKRKVVERSTQARKATKHAHHDSHLKSTELNRLRSMLPVDILKECLTKNVGKQKGWHRKEFGLEEDYDEKKKSQKYVQLNEFEKTQILYEYDLLLQHLRDTDAINKNKTSTKRHKRGRKKGRFMKNGTTKKNPITMKNLLHAWGIGKTTLNRIKNEKIDNALSKEMDVLHAFLSVAASDEENCEDNNNKLSVIESKEEAEKIYTTEFLFINHNLRKFSDSCEGGICTREDLSRERARAKKAFQNLSSLEISVWESRKREHLARQPEIKTQIIFSLQQNDAISYQALEGEVNSWCSASTIRRYIISREGYDMYPERIIPHLSIKQKQKHYEFSYKYLNNWGLGGGKYLLFHFDEKWFWGLLLRKTAKTFDEFVAHLKSQGLNEKEIRAYHKCHISKTMGIAMVGFAFEDSILNGGDGIKLEFTRSQSAKVAERKVTDKVTKEVKRVKGDIWYQDCAVTGSNIGTHKDPKFPLLLWFKHLIFDKVEKLVNDPNSKYYGYTPVFQGDNAGPHNDKKFTDYVQGYCKKKKWHWEPQGPQMPHMNVCDLAVFPSMSRAHATALRKKGGVKVMKEDEIWQSAEHVWNHMSSCNIARAFVLSHTVAQKIVKAKGDNIFLTGTKGGLHANVRKDFYDTETGVVRRDNTKIDPPK